MMNNMNNGLMFGMEGPNMEGAWYNPQTGDSFTVRNSFFQDNQYIVQTTDGRILDYNTLQNYVQSDRPIEMPKPQPKKQQLPAEVEDLIADTDTVADTETYLLPEDAELLSPKTLGSLGQQVSQSVQTAGYSQVVEPVQIQDVSIINKALAKRSLPDIQVGIDWKDFPEREVNMLIDVMDIPYDAIVAWYMSRVDVNVVTACLRTAIEDYVRTRVLPIAANVDPADAEVSFPDEIPTEEPVKKPRRSTNKKPTKSKK